MDYKKRLEEIHKESQEREASFLMQFKEGAPPTLALTGLWYVWENKALYSLAIPNDLPHAKQCFYTCGRIDEYLIRRYDARTLHFGAAHATYAALSDCELLIQRYSRLEDSAYDYQWRRGSIAMAIQHAMTGDWERLSDQVQVLKEKQLPKKKDGKWLEPDVLFFEGLLKQDLSQMKEALEVLLTAKFHQKRNGIYPIRRELISIPALGYAKLAWRCGLEVEVGSPLVPQALLPVHPLAQYEEAYDFLTELEM